MQNKYVFSFIIILFSGMTACDLLSVEKRAGEYPTVYPAMNLSDLEQMNTEYQAANDNHICSTLNKYGFTGYSEVFFIDGVSPCMYRDIVRVEMNNTDTLAGAAKKTLLKNSIYTGVEDTSALVLKELLPLPGCIICEGPDENRANIEWKLTFESQVIDTIEVIDTEITVFIDAEGVNRIWGNWHADFVIPPFINYGYLEAQQGLVGREIDMRNFTGEEFIYSIQEEDLNDKPRLVHIPWENENQIEMRTCWEVKVAYQGNAEFTGWLAYIDIEEGFLVDLVDN